MEWKMKLLGQKALDLLLPVDLSRRAHALLQFRMGNVSSWNEDRRAAEIQRGLTMAQYLHDKVSFRFTDSAVLEIGTGWHATDVILFYFLGANEIWTCDHMRHLDEDLVLAQVSAFDSALPEISNRCGANLHEVAARYDILKRSRCLKDVLQICRARYVSPCRFHDIRFPQDRFDLFYSYSTLQRVPTDDLRAYLASAHRAVRSGRFSLHCIHHSDHKARHSKSLG